MKQRTGASSYSAGGNATIHWRTRRNPISVRKELPHHERLKSLSLYRKVLTCRNVCCCLPSELSLRVSEIYVSTEAGRNRLFSACPEYEQQSNIILTPVKLGNDPSYHAAHANWRRMSSTRVRHHTSHSQRRERSYGVLSRE